MAGTDNGTAYLMPGFSLHDELALLVEAGLSPMAAVQAATRTPARYPGSRGGTIEPGRQADLVLLDADPLRDIRNTTRIDSLVVRGRYIDRTERRQMLDDVLAAARQPMPVVALAPMCLLVAETPRSAAAATSDHSPNRRVSDNALRRSAIVETARPPKTDISTRELRQPTPSRPAVSVI